MVQPAYSDIHVLSGSGDDARTGSPVHQNREPEERLRYVHRERAFDKGCGDAFLFRRIPGPRGEAEHALVPAFSGQCPPDDYLLALPGTEVAEFPKIAGSRRRRCARKGEAERKTD